LKKHWALPVDVSVRNTKGVELGNLSSPSYAKWAKVESSAEGHIPEFGLTTYENTEIILGNEM